jgi:transposase
MYCIGIDIADLTFTCSCVTPAFQVIWYGKTYDQNEDGWNALVALMQTHSITIANSRIVMEATGVYSERISFYLYQQGYRVYVEPPHKVHNAFYERGKTDPVDSRQIAEYGFRFADQLHAWQPREEILDLIAALLTTRELLVKMRTGCKNIKKSLSRKQRDFQTLQTLYGELSDDLKEKIKSIEAEIKTQIATNPVLKQTTDHLLKIKSVGFLVTVNFMLLTEGYKRDLKYQDLAAYIGICPFEHRSGTSVYRKPQADGAGPVRLRKQLYLAAMRLIRTNLEFKTYFDRKVKEGKSPRLVLTNIENRLLRVMCGVVKSGKPYIEKYASVKPD